MKSSLLIMAAGLGSRFGEGIKQLASVDRNDNIIMDYSIHDAIAAGFERIVFVIRRNIEADFRKAIGNRVEKVCSRLGIDVCYAFQELDALPHGFALPEGRMKPWGTGQVRRSCRQKTSSPALSA